MELKRPIFFKTNKESLVLFPTSLSIMWDSFPSLYPRIYFYGPAYVQNTSYGQCSAYLDLLPATDNNKSNLPRASVGWGTAPESKNGQFRLELLYTPSDFDRVLAWRSLPSNAEIWFKFSIEKITGLEIAITSCEIHEDMKIEANHRLYRAMSGESTDEGK